MKTFFGKLGAVLRRTWVWSLLLVLLLAVLVWFVGPLLAVWGARLITTALAARLSERALRLGGTVSGEHGIGLGKTKYMAAEHGEGWQVMAALKAALDPGNVMNPGKMLPGN